MVKEEKDPGLPTPANRNVRVLAALGEKGWIVFDQARPSAVTLSRASEQAGQALRHALGEIPSGSPEAEPPTRPAV